MKQKENNVALFEKKHVRRVWHEEQWWFVITDVISILTDSVNASDYFKKLRKRDPELGKLYAKGGVQFVPPLGLEFITAGGKQVISKKNYLSDKRKGIVSRLFCYKIIASDLVLSFNPSIGLI